MTNINEDALFKKFAANHKKRTAGLWGEHPRACDLEVGLHFRALFMEPDGQTPQVFRVMQKTQQEIDERPNDLVAIMIGGVHSGKRIYVDPAILVVVVCYPEFNPYN